MSQHETKPWQVPGFPFKKVKETFRVDPCTGCFFFPITGRCWSELQKHKIFENIGSCVDGTIYVKNN